MNIETLEYMIPKWDEIKITGRMKEINSSVIEIIGLSREENGTNIYMIYKDENMAKIDRQTMTPKTPRENKHQMNKRKYEVPFHCARSIKIGNEEYSISASEIRPVKSDSTDIFLKIAEFLKAGWKPEAIGEEDFKSLYYVELTLRDTGGKLPEIDSDTPISFEIHPEIEYHTIEKEFEFVVGEKYTEKFKFTDQKIDKEYEFYITEVHLRDERAEYEKEMERLLSLVGKERFEMLKDTMLGDIDKICPEGMRIPVIAYEMTDHDFVLNFYDKKYLDSPIDRTHKGGPVFVTMYTDAIGEHGYLIRLDALRTPVPANTKTIKAELFSYTVFPEPYEVTV